MSPTRRGAPPPRADRSCGSRLEQPVGPAPGPLPRQQEPWLAVRRCARPPQAARPPAGQPVYHTTAPLAVKPAGHPRASLAGDTNDVPGNQPSAQESRARPSRQLQPNWTPPQRVECVCSLLGAGVGDWMYSRLGGITPAEPGFVAVAIKPSVSRTLGPASVSVRLTTVRGRPPSPSSHLDAPFSTAREAPRQQPRIRVDCHDTPTRQKK